MQREQTDEDEERKVKRKRDGRRQRETKESRGRGGVKRIHLGRWERTERKRKIKRGSVFYLPGWCLSTLESLEVR